MSDGKASVHPGRVLLFEHVYVGLTDSIASSELGRGFVGLSDSSKDFVTELSSPALPLDHVVHVVSMSTCSKMPNVAARGVVTAVENVSAVWDGSHKQLVGDPVRSPIGLPVAAHQSVPVAVSRPGPGVTGVRASGLIDLGPEAVFEGPPLESLGVACPVAPGPVLLAVAEAPRPCTSVGSIAAFSEAGSAHVQYRSTPFDAVRGVRR